MKYESPSESKIKYEETSDGTKIIIPSSKNWFIILFIGFWLIGWAVGELFAISMLLGNIFGFIGESAKSNTEPSFINLFMVAWLGAWTIGGFFAFRTFLWQLSGKEEIIINNGSLIIIKDYKIYKSNKAYQKVHIKDVRLKPQQNTPFGSMNWGYKQEGLIAFDYGAATKTFCLVKDEAEAKKILSTMKNKYPFYFE